MSEVVINDVYLCTVGSRRPLEASFCLEAMEVIHGSERFLPIEERQQRAVERGRSAAEALSQLCQPASAQTILEGALSLAETFRDDVRLHFMLGVVETSINAGVKA